MNSDNYVDNGSGAVPRNIEIVGNRFEKWDTTARFPVATRSTELAEHPVHAIFLRDASDVSVIGNEFISSDKRVTEMYAIRL